ncbi:hypothetical protein [Duncaniella freteri]|uniref:hypothetical protein n=1 Tax=Duncaniella freteri TaxID=2530391 RepID=UPI003F66FDDE
MARFDFSPIPDKSRDDPPSNHSAPGGGEALPELVASVQVTEAENSRMESIICPGGANDWYFSTDTSVCGKDV